MGWRLLLVLGLCVSVLVSAANGALVVPTEGTYLRFVGSPYAGESWHPDGGPLYGFIPGGEFKFEVYTQEEAAVDRDRTDPKVYLGDFVTFCAENLTGQHISLDQVYYYASTKASDEFSFADWIYYGYLTANEDSGNNPVPDRASGTLALSVDAARIQDALWRALQQPYYGYSNSVWASWQAAYNRDKNDPNNWPTYEPTIAVLQTVSGGEAQDQWVYVPNEKLDDPVPEPMSLVIWSVLGLGSAGLAIWSRRRRNGLALAGNVRWSHENREAILALIERGRRG